VKTFIRKGSTSSGEKPIRPPIVRRQATQQPAPHSGPRYNEFIQSAKVRVIDENGENLGVMFTKEARAQAAAVSLDLVEVSPNAEPPVCKFLDIGKFKYEAQKKAALARKHQKTQEVKEIKVRPNIDAHDYETKMKAVKRFLEDGDKVKITLRFRGREMAHNELGMVLLKRMQDDLHEVAKVEAHPKLEGRQMLMVLSPK
jgi:translation initiation factor IF-3